MRVIASPIKRADAATTAVIFPDAIRTVPANDAWDLVRQTAGVEVHLQGQGPGFASDAVMRGYTSDHSVDVASFIDGVPLNEPVSGHAEGYADWNALIPEAVARPAARTASGENLGDVVALRATSRPKRARVGPDTR